MHKKLSFIYCIFFLFSAVLSLTNFAYANTVKFNINGFEVKVYPQNFEAMNLRSDNVNRLRIERDASIDYNDLVIESLREGTATRDSETIHSLIRNRIFSGKGKTSIDGVPFDVKFEKIAIKLQGQNYVATKGKVTGVDGSNIDYQKGRFSITIDSSTISITPSVATASVKLKIQSTNFTQNPVSYISLQSDQCAIASDGSLFGDNFHGDLSFKLKKSANYELGIKMLDSQFVMIGDIYASGIMNNRDGIRRFTEGVKLQGYASRESTTAYKFTGTIGKKLDDSFDLTLQQEFWAYPETDYKLCLKSGSVELVYNSLGLHAMNGEYVADIYLPPLVKNTEYQEVIISDALLRTDETDALFNNVIITNRLFAGKTFSIEPDQKEGAWAFFPKWPLNPNQHSSFNNIEKPGQDCKNIQDFLDGFENASVTPGVTLKKGILHFTSPQINTGVENNLHQVKTLFQGILSLTQWGITGRLHGIGYSFVPENQEISNSEITYVKTRTTWEEIISAGNNMPEEPRERFLLSDLRILDMQAKSIEFCRNFLVEGKAEFRQFVHFPFPSFINLEFEDLSLNLEGLFSTAKGPVASLSIIFPEGFNNNYASQESLDLYPNIPIKDTEMQPNPDTHILWAWRLPVSFADRGVTINHMPANTTKISVEMITSSINGAPINSSELWLKPLYSSNSLVRSGLRFKADMSSKTGEFSLTGWDTNPFFANMYTRPENERKIGFHIELNDISLKGITLIDQDTNPTTRSYDFAWEGKIQFPFFTNDNKSTWKEITYKIKDLIPELENPLSMTARNNKYDLINSQVVTLMDPELEVKIKELIYEPKTGNFKSYEIEAFDIDSGGNKTDLEAVYFLMSSFSNGTVYTNSSGPHAEPLDVGGGDTNDANECGRNKWVRRIMVDWQPSSAIRDIVCYDNLAVEERGIERSCSDNSYFEGTYEVRTRKCSDLSSCYENAVISIPNTKYYTRSKKLSINNSNLVADSDEMDESHPFIVNIPSAQFTLSPDGRLIEGAFGATLSTVASSLPYEGELRFKLDTTCGYYYFQGAGSFTYYARFSGQIFIVHAPYEFLTQPSVFIGVSDILDDLRIRALCDSVSEFTDNAGLSGVQPSTVITGLFTSGNASKDFDFGIANAEATLGPGLYLYDFYPKKWTRG